MKRKILSALLAFCIMCSLLTVNASAAQVLSGKHGTDFATGTLAERLETIFYSGISGCVSPSIPAVGGTLNMNQHYTTTFANQSGSNSDKQCHAYTRAAYSYLFGYNMADGSYRVEFSDAKGRNTLNYNLFVQYRVRCGAYLRTTNNSNGTFNGGVGHSMIILGYNSDGVTTLEGNYDGYGGIVIRYYPWNDFNNKLLSGKNLYVCSLSQPTTKIYANLGYTDPVITTPTTSTTYFSCNVRIDCVNGQTVNLYNNLGDSSRADYFSRGQSVQSTYGAKLSDGSTWYQISATSSGVVKTFWLKYESNKMTVSNIGSITGPSTTEPSNSLEYFNCDVRIDCVNGQTVNLYNNPGDSSRVDYFSRGQSVQSTYGAKLGDGSTWYRISATSSGVVKTFWLKYERSKMTVSDINPTYTIYFNANGGSVSTSSKTVTANSTYGTLPTPTRTGYKFDGWYTSSSGGSWITSSTTVNLSGNQTLYAHWDEQSYTVSFNTNGGSVSTSSKTVINGDTYGSLPTPTRSGYTFEGWYTSSSGGNQIASSTTVSLSGNQTLYAHWSEQSYTVNFNANGGSVWTSSKTVINGDTYGSLPTPTRSGYTFDGWYTSPYNGSQVTSGITVSLSESQTLYAHWSEQSYTVNFNANGGSVWTSSKTVINGDTYGSLPTPTRSGYTFEGWYTSPYNGSQVTSETTVNLSESQTLYAHWEGVQVQPQPTVSFTDVNPSDWFALPVQWALEENITAGTGDGTTFSPQETCSVAQILTFIWRAYGSPEPTFANTFTDVPSGVYYEKAAVWAREMGLIQGNKLDPLAPCTRAMAVNYLWKAAHSPYVAASNQFADVPSDYAQAVDWAVSNSITFGTSDTTFSPNLTCTRAEIITFLYRDMA